jgi:CxxC motif-containing protein (DUF1111 family)
MQRKRKSDGEASWQWHQGMRVLGRLGWQAKSYSIRDQTGRASHFCRIR